MMNIISLAYQLFKHGHMTEEELPKEYKQGARSTHDDWLPGLRWIPRKWTMYRLPLPPYMVEGNATFKRQLCQPGYPMPPRAATGSDSEGTFFMAPDFIPESGQWLRLAVWLNGRWQECYSAWTFELFGHKIHISYGLKPDYADPHWGFPEIRLAIDTLFKGGKLQ